MLYSCNHPTYRLSVHDAWIHSRVEHLHFAHVDGCEAQLDQPELTREELWFDDEVVSVLDGEFCVGAHKGIESISRVVWSSDREKIGFL